jgi:hypothetical protein
MKTINHTIAALVMASSLAVAASEASAQNVRQICDPMGTCFVCQRGSPTCEASYALSRIFRTPGPTANMQAILPPSPPPPAGPSYPERYATAPPPSPQQAPPQMTRDEERENVIRQGEAFCQKYPDDKVCHPLPAQPPQ